MKIVYIIAFAFNLLIGLLLATETLATTVSMAFTGYLVTAFWILVAYKNIDTK